MNVEIQKIRTLLVAILLLLGTSTSAFAKDTPGYNNKIPDSIMTPDKVDTRLGTLEFFDGIPTKETAALLYDNLDFLRGVETFLNGMPATSLEGLRRGSFFVGAKKSNQVILFDRLMDSIRSFSPATRTPSTPRFFSTSRLTVRQS